MKISVRIFGFPLDSYAFGYTPESFNESPSNANLAGATVALDAQGALTVSLPTEAKTDRAYQYTFEGDVEDISRQHIANRAQLSFKTKPSPQLMRDRVTTTIGKAVDP